MSSAGHVLDMIKRMQQNELLKDARKNRFRRSKKVHEHQNIENHLKNNLIKQKVSNKEMDLIKEKIRTRIRKERKKQQIFIVLSLLIIIFSVISLLIL